MKLNKIKKLSLVNINLNNSYNYEIVQLYSQQSHNIPM